jgi:hypothetical protein
MPLLIINKRAVKIGCYQCLSNMASNKNQTFAISFGPDFFWKNHPILLNNGEMYMQRMHYLHENPVRAGFVRYSYDWLYSSAIDYYIEDQKGLLDVLILE